MAKQTPEGRVKDAIKKKLQELDPNSFYFLPVSNGMGRHGVPDFIGCVPTEITQDMVGNRIGVFVGIEAKTYNGKVSPLQHQCLDEIAAAFGAAIVVWGSDDVDRLDFYVETTQGLADKEKPK